MNFRLYPDKDGWLDWPLLTATLGLMILGGLFIYSATTIHESIGLWQRFQDESGGAFIRYVLGQRWFVQVAAYGIGAVAACMVCLADYHIWARWSLVLYWASIFLLILVLIDGIGVIRGGARRWIDLGFFNLQPSELGKLSFILYTAHFLSRPMQELRIPSIFVKCLAMAALPFALVFREPDLGSAMLFLPVSLAMMFVAGVPHRYLNRLMITCAVFGGLLLANILLAPPAWRVTHEYQRERLLVFFGLPFTLGADDEARDNATERERDKSYNVNQALLSVGSGGLFGKGWKGGNQTALGFLPRGVAHTDFIFSVIAEEKGFMGSLTVITLYGVLLFSGIKIAGQARDRLGKLLAVGVVTILFIQVFINLGMNIRIMPVTGLPLPLLSYGGTSVVSTLIALGILQNVYIYRKGY